MSRISECGCSANAFVCTSVSARISAATCRCADARLRAGFEGKSNSGHVPSDYGLKKFCEVQDFRPLTC